MTWRKAMNRRRAERLAQELPAVARPSEGPAETPGKSSLNCAPGGSPPKVTPGASFSGEPTEAAVRACVAEGLSDQNLADHFGRSKSWALYIRRRYGIAAAIPQGHRDSASRFGFVPGAAHEARYAAFFAAAGEYPSYTDRQISNYERVYDLTRARRRIVDMTPALHGDPAPDRPRA